MIVINCFKKRDNYTFFLAAVLFALIFCQTVNAHGLKYHEFKPIDHRVGMDASAVNCVVQDNQGLIWLGTDRGLYSFDGYTTRHYISKVPQEQANIGVVYCALMVDSIHLWLGTDNGLFVFNTFTDCNEQSPSGLPKSIRAISRIDSHSFWIGGLNGLYRYNSQTNKAIKVSAPQIPHQAVYTILRYDANTFYFGTYNGLCRFDLPTNRFEKIALKSGYSADNLLILSLLPDYSRNCIWVGTEGGLFAYYPSRNQATAEVLFRGNSVKSLLLDNQGLLWAGTDNGLFIYEPSTKKYRLIRHDARNDRSILNNVVWSIFTDREQNIWVGTDAGASLFIYNNHYKRQSISELTGSNEGNYIISLLGDAKNNVWLGGTNGIIKLEPSGKTTWYQQNSNLFPLPHNKVRYVFEDADGDIWIATDGSICLYNPKTLQFIRYQIEDSTHTRKANWSYAICQDETRKLWIATCLGGLFVVDKQKLIASEGKILVAEQNYYANGQAQGVSGNMFEFLSLDKEHNIWAGTYRAGVNKIDRLNQTITQFTTSSKHPLSSDDVTAMLIDSDNYLWIALRNKLIRIDTKNYSQKTITDPRMSDAYVNALADDGKRIWMGLSSGLFFIDKLTLKTKQINSGGNFYSSVFYDKKNHRLIAGGNNEYVEFDPETILAQDQQNKLFITSLWINDKLWINDSSLNQSIKINQSIRFSQSVELPHHFNNLTFTFSEYCYNEQQNVQYAYKLENLDADWHFCEKGNNRITYNNLTPGNYTLLVSRIGIDGTPLPQPLKFSVTIQHPWYSTWIAKSIYLILFILLLAAIVNYYTILNRLRYERIEKAKTVELTAHKIDFLTNISHELKTPLSMIVGPLSKIIEQVKPPILKDQLADVRKNALKMNSLIHQMMEASRQEFDEFGLIVSTTDVVAFVRSVVSVFEKSLKEREIQIEIDATQATFFIEADVLKLEIILNNILSNASKFAPNNSIITIKIEEIDNQVKIAVSDNGSGIDEQDLPHVFERFFQSRHTLAQNKEGSGVGLHIVKQYVQLHNGKVEILSNGVQGTTVEVFLPVKQEVDTFDTYSKEQKTVSSNRQDKKPLLLIVEDNADIASFIAKSLESEFQCICAQNGKLGLEAAIAQHPNIIISDIMMPVMDGMEMCRKIKENIATSLIPIILLTAKDDNNIELMGYRTGADAFISKPFEIEYLSTRLNQLLRGRDLLVQKARQEAIIQPKQEDVTSSDEKLLAVITQIIEDELTNPDLSVTVLSEKSGYSLKQIYRRIKSLTGQTAVDYIRSVKLKKAAMLLSRKTFTVAEVMYMVGFNNHSYFAKRFLEMYGKSPKQYAEDANDSKNNSEEG